jgi:hypothetical protein
MFYFATYKTESGDKIEKFITIAEYFRWLQDFWNKCGILPKNLCVFKAECVFDGS